MRKLLVSIACLPLLQACATQYSGFEAERNVVEKVDNASCSQLAENMNLALSTMDSSKQKAQFGEMAMMGSTAALIVAPAALLMGPLGMAIPAIVGAGGLAATDGMLDQIEPEMLYRESHRAYSNKRCSPKVAFGYAVPSSRATSISIVNPTVKGLQQQLNARGYDAGKADGIMGPRTREALLRFQRENGIPQSGKPDPVTLGFLGL